MKFKFFVLFILIQLIIIPIVNFLYDLRKDFILDNTNIQLELNYKSVVKNFDTLALTVFKGFIYKNKIRDAMAFQEKKRIYKRILKNKEFLDSINFSDIHFHTYDNKSLLYLENPDTTGFDLTKDRYSVVYANKNKKQISGLEVGRRTVSYRYVYPMFDDDNIHIGSVENSLSIKAFINQFEKVYNINMNFILLKAIVDKKSDTKYLKINFEDALENDKYYLYKFDNHFIKNKSYLSYLNENVLNEIANKIKSQKSFSLQLKNNKILSFLPVLNTKKAHLGYFLLFSTSNELKVLNESLLYEILLFEFIVLLILFIIYRIMIQKEILEKEVKNKTNELIAVNSTLEKSILIEVEKSRKKDFQLMETAKMAQMGEMIGNIAHQWRQPLSAISTMSTGMIINKQIGNLSDEKLISNLENINNKSLYLSEIINTFINFFKNEKELRIQSLSDIIIDSLNIIESTLKHNGIRIINNITKDNDIELNIVTGELPEVIINLLSNAKDAIVDNNIENPFIEFDLQVHTNYIIITIQDNAGGIPSDIIDKVFDPYFTTKHQSQGTGLGLHMSKRIISESLKGNLYVKNNNNGAKFFIEIPIK